MAFDAPTGERETALAELWCEVLRLQSVSRHDNFFALGGHSLLATQVVSRARARLGLALPLRAMFESPTLGALAARTDLAWSGAGAPCTIDRQPRGGLLPTSFSQRRMWLVQQLNPHTTAYNICFALRLKGWLDADALAGSLDHVARRHEAFRTRFEAVDGEPMQCIDAFVPVPLVRADLRNIASKQREAEAACILRAASQQRFDLSLPALHSTSLVQLGDEDHVLLWLVHHAIADQWAGGILVDELRQSYNTLLQGRSPVLPSRQPLEFADHAAWQRKTGLQSPDDAHFRYWHAQLAGLPALALPTDKPRRGPLTGRGGLLQLPLGGERLHRLRRFSTAHGVTPFMTLLACLDMMLARYSGQTDIAVGAPVANRLSVESESLVGTLVNTVVMRADLSAEPSFTGLLAAVKETALQAYAHQETPFDMLVERLATQRDRNFSPLVQVMFNVINTPFEVTGFAGLEVGSFPLDPGAAQFDLSLTADIDTFGQIQLEYAEDLFERATAQRMLESYLALLDQVLDDPSRSVASYPLMGNAERAEQAAWNATQAPFDSGLRLGDLLRRQALASGSATAVEFEGRRVSYAELDAAAVALARRLRALGVRPGDLVGVCLERSVELVSALLGVVYSGAAFVPLDPADPPERLARMCEDAGMSVLVSRGGELAQVGTAFPAALRIVHVDDSRMHAELQTEFELAGKATDAAYVIFTSGSTGRPKGAMNAHRGVVNWLQWMQSEYRLTPQDRVLLKTPYSFDVSLREFFWPLTVGATIVVARPEGHRDAAYLVYTLRSEHITLLHFVPSMLRIFLEEPGLEHCSSVRRVVCSGEALPVDVVERFFQRMPQSKLCNLYGPTEAAVEVTHWECRPGDASGIVPIGRPVANTQMHVLDARMRQQPVGVPGDLYIGGVQVGMGYVGRPELTRERFIDDPFNPGARLYKTGDLARWTSDGVIDYLGRADDQVKIRGHRIELGEIEAHLGAHPQVARNVVIAREDKPGDRRLVAYIVARDDLPGASELRQHLRQHMPEYMVPQHYVRLDAIPLLVNGKIDRKALPVPTDTAVIHDRAFWVPRTDAEVAIAEIWQELLGIDQISSSDNFFDLGGHSLLAMRAVGEMHKRLGMRLSVRRLVFESLAQLAATPQAVPAQPPQGAPTATPRTTKFLISGLKRMLTGKGTRGSS
ncbi:MAG: amino acid adenylation domain-containing protein [Rhizobacter sp.]|nr:amino acid adenylation domain-containing protein [Rhizobacter sp.]